MKETRKCHHCGRYSWVVAEGKSCPWCTKKTTQYHNKMNHILTLIAVISMCVIAIWLARA